MNVVATINGPTTYFCNSMIPECSQGIGLISIHTVCLKHWNVKVKPAKMTGQ